MRYVSPLTEDERAGLNDIMNNARSSRTRRRAHAVLLSDRGYKTDDIADIFQVGRNTVTSWIDAWERSGYSGLHDRARSGRPPILTADEKKTAEELIENSRSPRTVIQKLSEITGKVVSSSTIRRLALGAGLIWKRIRKTVRPKRNKNDYERAKKEIGELREWQELGETDIYYFDESGFDLQPSVPYARQPRGETLEVPSFRSPRLNVLGFLNTENNEFYCLTFECSVDSDIVVACFDRFSEIITEKTVVILDSASCHTSGKFAENIGKWEKKGLFIKYLPAYSPELNPVEILWRFIKYLWLTFSAYTSFDNLVEEVEKILRGIGSEYVINFS